MTTTNQFYITSQPLALVSSGNNASIPGSFSANSITAPTANLSSITATTVTANTVVGQTATFSGNVLASHVMANGAGLTSINASNVTSGTVDNARLPASISVTSIAANGAGLTSINASNVSSGTVDNARLPASISVSGNISATRFVGDGSFLANIPQPDLSAVGTNLVPGTSSSYDLGSQSMRWRNLFLGGSAISFGDGVTFDTYNWSYLTNYIVPPKELTPMNRSLFKGAAQDHSGFVSEGNVYMFGRNDFGQLGLGDTQNRLVPTIVPGITNAHSIACGQSFTLVRTTGSTVYAFGVNTNGQLGDGTTTTRTSPVLVNGVTTATMVAAGQTHSLFLLANGTVVGYGGNALGQLGSGSVSTTNTTLVSASMPSNTARFIACGTYHSLFLLDSGAAYMFGDNAYNQLGVSSASAPTSPTPVIVAGISNVVSAACGDTHTLLVRYNGEIVSYGRNNAGQLGVGDKLVKTSPTIIVAGTLNSSLGLSISVDAGLNHTVIALADGTVKVCGSNSVGQLGAGTTVTEYLTPTTLTGYSAYSVACGRNHSLLLLNNTVVYTSAIIGFGDNTYGQMGDAQSNITTRWFPNRIYESSGSRNIERTAGQHGAHVDSDGVLYMKGLNTNGQLGDGISITSNIAKPVSSLVGRIVSASGAAASTYAVTSTGELYAWGLNTNSELGDGTVVAQNRPIRINVGSLAGKTIVRVAAMGRSCFALDSLGVVHAWGFNQAATSPVAGYLGDGTNVNRSTPVAITGGSLAGKSVVQISPGNGAAASGFTLAIDSTGVLHGWGYNTLLGYGNSNSPLVIVSGTATGKLFVSCSSGGLSSQSHMGAVDSTGTLHMAGSNAGGQIGNNTTTNATSFVAINSFGSLVGKLVISVSCGPYSTLALDSTGRVHAWGYNSAGVLGDNTVTQRNVPVAITGGSLANKTVIAIAMCCPFVANGEASSYALDSTGGLHAWGYNANGQLGDGTTTNRLVPVLVNGTIRDTFLKLMSQGYMGTHKLFMNRITNGLQVAGTNTYGQLGDGTTVSKFYVTNLPPFASQVVSAANSNDHSGAVLSNGHVYVWGRNDSGQSGSSNVSLNVAVPTRLTTISNGLQVRCGDGFTLIRLQDKTVMALGSNASSKLGLTSVATNSYTSTPTIIPTLTSIEDIACGPDFALACDQSGALWTWGNNATGSTGRGTIVGTTAIPTVVDSSVWNNDKVIAVAAGESHAVIITQSLGGSRRVFTAGSNLYGQLGRATQAFTATPVSTFGHVWDGMPFASPLSLACGAFHTAVYMANHRIYTFGRNNATQLGTTGADRTTPYVISDLDVSGVSSGALNTYVEFPNKKVSGYGTYYASGFSMALGRGVPDTSGLAIPTSANRMGYGGGMGAFNAHSGILTATGSLFTVGDNSQGQLGDGTTSAVRLTWQEVILGAEARPAAFVISQYNTTVLDTSGKVWSFGYGAIGVLGTGTTTISLTPVFTSGYGSIVDKTIVAIAAQLNARHVLDSSGQVHGYGQNLYAMLGDGSITQRNSAVLINGGSLSGKTVVAISGGDNHALFLDSLGKVHACGGNQVGQIGNGVNNTVSPFYSSLFPLGDASSSTGSSLFGITVVAIAAAGYSSYALDSNGSIHAWGQNNVGQLGDNSTASKYRPVKIVVGSVAGKNIVAIAAQGYATYALDSTGVVHACGTAYAGGLGNGTTTPDALVFAAITGGSLTGKIVVRIGATTNCGHAIDSTGGLHGWGENGKGQLGDGTTTQRTSPVLISASQGGSGTTPLFVNFTGQHRCFVDGYAPSELHTLEGLIVVSDKNTYVSMPRRGQSAITINESLPLVSLSSVARDKRAFGVVSLSYNENTINAEKQLELQSIGDVRVHTNSVGEGAMWVCDIEGSLEAGDFVTTSSVKGYGMRQADDFIRNYTVAKVTMSCDFTAPLVPVEELKKDAYEQNILDSVGNPIWETVMEGGIHKMEPAYKMRYLDADGAEITKEDYDSNISEGVPAFRAAFMGCTYHCG